MADGLRRLDGVADVEVDLQANLCTVTPSPDRLPALAGFAEAVRGAGLRPGRLWIEARGTAGVGAAGARTFRIAGSETWLRLDGVADVAPVLAARVDWRPDAILVPESVQR